MLKSSQQTLYQEGLSQFLVISTVSLPSCTPHGEWICLQNNGAVFCPHHVLEPASNQYCISLLLDFPPVDEDCVFVLYFSPSFLFRFVVFVSFQFYFFFFLSPVQSVPLSLTTYTLTLAPPCHISTTRQNGYGLLLGSHLHISPSYIFQKVVRGFHSFSLLLWGL